MKMSGIFRSFCNIGMPDTDTVKSASTDARLLDVLPMARVAKRRFELGVLSTIWTNAIAPNCHTAANR